MLCRIAYALDIKLQNLFVDVLEPLLKMKHAQLWKTDETELKEPIYELFPRNMALPKFKADSAEVGDKVSAANTQGKQSQRKGATSKSVNHRPSAAMRAAELVRQRNDPRSGNGNFIGQE